MERLTDCAQGYCEMYCKKYTFCFEDPENCAFKNEIKLYDALKSIEGIVPLDRLLELADADRAGRLVVLPCKVGAHVHGRYENWSGEVMEFSINSDGVHLYVRSGGGGFYCKPEDIEVEAALKGGEC